MSVPVFVTPVSDNDPESVVSGISAHVRVDPVVVSILPVIVSDVVPDALVSHDQTRGVVTGLLTGT